MDKDIFTYWIGNKPLIIQAMERQLDRHCGERVLKLTPKNIEDYIEIPDNFYEMVPAHQADYVRVKMIYEYGGCWLDADAVVLTDLKELFALKNVLIFDTAGTFSNACIVAEKGSPMLKQWLDKMMPKIAKYVKGEFGWNKIGSDILETLDYKDFTLLDGKDNIYPVFWREGVEEYLLKPYEYYKEIIRDFQPFIMLTSRTYRSKHLDMDDFEKHPLSYFLKVEKDVAIFTDIWEHRKWNEMETKSGPGSTLRETITLRKNLTNTLDMLNVKTVLDLGCGEFNWQKELDLSAYDYHGVDLVDKIIESNSKLYPEVKFATKIPADIKFDVTIVRDMFVHLPNSEILKKVRNLRGKYLAATTFVGNGAEDIYTGQWRPINLQRLFNTAPLLLLPDTDGCHPNKCLGFWDLQYLKRTV